MPGHQRSGQAVSRMFETAVRFGRQAFFASRPLAAAVGLWRLALTPECMRALPELFHRTTQSIRLAVAPGIRLEAS
jgi:hypothetical protein